MYENQRDRQFDYFMEAFKKRFPYYRQSSFLKNLTIIKRSPYSENASSQTFIRSMFLREYYSSMNILMSGMNMEFNAHFQNQLEGALDFIAWAYRIHLRAVPEKILTTKLSVKVIPLYGNRLGVWHSSFLSREGKVSFKRDPDYVSNNKNPDQVFLAIDELLKLKIAEEEMPFWRLSPKFVETAKNTENGTVFATIYLFQFPYENVYLSNDENLHETISRYERICEKNWQKTYHVCEGNLKDER